MPKEKENKEPKEKIETKIDQKIDEALKEKVDSELNNKIKEIVDKKLEEKIKKTIERKVEEKATLPEEKEVEAAPEKISPFVRTTKEFRENFHLCWRGACRPISLIILLSYALISFILLYCRFVSQCGLTTINVISVVALYIIIAMVIISLLFSIFSKYPRTALIFWILLDIPLLIIVAFFAAKYIASIIIALIFVLRIIQTARREY